MADVIDLRSRDKRATEDVWSWRATFVCDDAHGLNSVLITPSALMNARREDAQMVAEHMMTASRWTAETAFSHAEEDGPASSPVAHIVIWSDDRVTIQASLSDLDTPAQRTWLRRRLVQAFKIIKGMASENQKED